MGLLTKDNGYSDSLLVTLEFETVVCKPGRLPWFFHDWFSQQVQTFCLGCRLVYL